MGSRGLVASRRGGYDREHGSNGSSFEGMGWAIGFEFSQRGDAVVITHRGRKAATLRGGTARRFLEDVQHEDPQQVMARATGQYKRGNERLSRDHPRNR